MEKSFTKWRSLEKDDSDESDTDVRSPDKVEESDSNSIDSESNSSYTDGHSEKNDEETNELEVSNIDSDVDVIESSIIIPEKSNTKLIKPIIVDDSDKEEGSSDSDSLIVTHKKKNCNIIYSDSETEEVNNVEDSSTDSKKNATEKKSSFRASSSATLVNNSISHIGYNSSSSNDEELENLTLPELNKNVQKSVEHIKITSSSPNRNKSLNTEIIDVEGYLNNRREENSFKGSLNKGIIDVEEYSNNRRKENLFKGSSNKGIIDVEEYSNNRRKENSFNGSSGATSISNESNDLISCSPISSNIDSEIKNSLLPKHKTNIQKSFEEIDISGSFENKSDISKECSTVTNKSVNSFMDSENVNLIGSGDASSSSSTTKTYVQSKFVPDPVEGKLKTDIGERIRVQQLLADQKRLELQIGKSREELGKTKTLLLTANLSILPDKGNRLQLTLARQEAGLRDLMIQENLVKEAIERVSDELLDHVKKTQAQPNQQPQWSKLPSAMVNLNEMGKKALETHRTQQALTVEALTRLHNSLKSCPSEEAETTDPLGLTINLMPHQKHALAWLLWREGEKPSGGILADDMGLGKTLTMISLILKAEEVKLTSTDNSREKVEDSSSDEEEESSESKSNWLSKGKQKTYRGKTLVVCPATLIGQWEKEISNRVKPNLLRVEMYHGPNREKRESRLARRDVVITTYNIVGRENGEKKGKTGEVHKGPIFNIRWERIILDEAHQIRNHKSQSAEGACALRGKYRWVLTGTPIHNKELDLYALLKFIRCSPFDDLAVWKRWVDNRDASGNQRLSTMVKALMLRRTKEDLQNKGSLNSLPTKEFSTVEVHLNAEELLVYQKVLDFSKTLLAQFIEQKAEKEEYYGHMPINNKARYKYDAVEDAFSGHPDLAKLHNRIKNMTDLKTTDILVLLLRLRQICCHPCLIKAMLNKEEFMNVGVEDSEGLDLGLLEKMGDLTLVENDEEENELGAMKMSPLNPNNPIFSPDQISSKIKAVVETLEKFILNTEDKAVIVSQWSSMLDLIYNVLKSKKIKCVLLTGSVPVKVRGGIVEDFNQVGHGPKIMLLSLTAGGVGLNLVGANHLLMVDLHWNPQLEAQACDRIYRVGQRKQVHIYKFLCIETIEERIQKLQQKKLDLAQNVLTGTNIIQASKLTLDDLKMLFSIK